MDKVKVFIATVLLERNRWTPDKLPSYRVSEWIPRFTEAGFDGIELWENHVARATSEEVALLKTSDLPIAIYNSYATFDSPGDPTQKVATRFIKELKAPRVKFNVGSEADRTTDYLNNVISWYKTLPVGTELLCECHPGTVLETPAAAAEALQLWQQADVNVKAIIHPFNLEPIDLRAWFHYLGTDITHVHIQRHDGKWRPLHAYPARVRENMAIMRQEGFAGTYSIEFTEGVGVRDEDVDALFASACRDLETLREALSRHN